jgi:hypothetical protein
MVVDGGVGGCLLQVMRQTANLNTNATQHSIV